MKDTFYLRAEENLVASEMLFDASLFNASANRAYYSAFHIATAVFIRKEFRAQR